MYIQCHIVLIMVLKKTKILSAKFQNKTVIEISLMTQPQKTQYDVHVWYQKQMIIEITKWNGCNCQSIIIIIT